MPPSAESPRSRTPSAPPRIAPVVARSATIHAPVAPVAYDCVILIFVRHGSAVLLSEFGERPVTAGDIVVLGANTLCGSDPKDFITVTTLYLDRDYVVNQIFGQHATMLADRLDAQDFAEELYSEPAQILRLGEHRAGMLMPWLDELVALSVVGPLPGNFYRMQSQFFAVEAAFDERLAFRSQELAELTENRRRLQNESDKLLATHFADVIDLETLKRHQDRIRAGLADIDRRLTSKHDQHEGSRKQLATALSLLVDCATLYARTNDHGKRLANQALVDGIESSEDERATIRFAKPFAALAPASTLSDVRGSTTSEMVDLLRAYSKHLRNAPDPRQLADKARRSCRRTGDMSAVKKRARQLRPDEVQELIAHYQENGSVSAAAKALSITRQTAGAYLAEAGIATVRRMCEADIFAAATAYNEGQSAAQISRRLGFDPQTVLTALRSVGVMIRPRPGYARRS